MPQTLVISYAVRGLFKFQVNNAVLALLLFLAIGRYNLREILYTEIFVREIDGCSLVCC